MTKPDPAEIALRVRNARVLSGTKAVTLGNYVAPEPHDTALAREALLAAYRYERERVLNFISNFADAAHRMGDVRGSNVAHNIYQELKRELEQGDD